MITGTRGWGLTAFQVLDSRGVPTVCAVLTTKNRTFTATIPSGTSSGKSEAVELRDGKKAFHGKGATNAVENVKKIAKKLPLNFYKDQEKLDSLLLKLDGTPNKSRLGANALLAVSLVAVKAAAAENEKALFDYFVQFNHSKRVAIPVPTPTMIDGGKHGGNKLSTQEFLLFPVKFSTFGACTRAIDEVYFELRQLILKKFGAAATNVGQEGGFSPPLFSTPAALDLVLAAIDAAGYSKKIKLGLDVAASEFYNKTTKKYDFEGKTVSSEKLAHFYYRLLDDYPIVSIEDPFAEEDWPAFSNFTSRAKIQVVGDDLLTTNPSRILRGIFSNACNALLLKPNQIGTITETLEAAQLARGAGWVVFASHRAGDSEDTFLCDLAASLNSEFIKIGAPCRGERTAKYNRFLFLEEFHKLKLAKPKLR